MGAMPSPGPRRLRRWGIAAAVLVLIAGAVVAVVVLHAPGNVSHPNLSFTAPTTTTGPAKPPPKQVVPPFEWPRYGFDAARTRFFGAPRSLAPPLRVGWRYNDYALLEFPPVIYGNVIYLIDDDGSAKAINKTNGRLIWAAQGRHARRRLPGSRASARTCLLTPAVHQPERRPEPGQRTVRRLER